MEESHSDNLRLMLRALTKLGDKVAANPGEALLELDQLIEQYPGLTQAVEKLTQGIQTDDSQNTDEVLTAPQRKALMIFDFDKTLC